MTTSTGPSAEPQPVLAPLSSAAIFLVFTIRQGGESQVRELLPDLPGLQRSVGFRNPDALLSFVCGIGSDAWDRLFAGSRPAHLHPFQPVQGVKHHAPATAGDLLFHIRAQSFDLCFDLAALITQRLNGAADIVDEVHAFRYFDARDLLGFVDGTENPTGNTAARAVIVGTDDPGFAGGSYVVVQRYVHDLDKWNAMTVEEQERIIGRTKLDNIELGSSDPSHVNLTTIVDSDGTERKILRDNMPFGTIGKDEFGTYFIGYTASPAVLELMLHRMFVGEPPGSYDRILDVSTATTGTLFAVPPLDFFDDLPSPPVRPTPQ